jgi:H+-transporting ATPase
MHENIGKLVESLQDPAQAPSPEATEPAPAYSSRTDSSLTNTDPSLGLLSAEAASRRRHFGPNELSENIESNLEKFLGYFIGPVQFVMEGAVLLAAGLQFWVDFGVICGMLLLNACVGFFQEYQANTVISQLKEHMALMAAVVRDGGARIEVAARDLVVGDIVELWEGCIVPADGRVLVWNEESSAPVLLVDQSTITGESAPVEKTAGREVFSSSAVRRGVARMVVTATGDGTFIGKAALLVNKAERVGHFGAVVSSIGTVLLVVVVLFITFGLVANFYHSATMTQHLTFILVITLVGVPVGLPVVVTTTLAVGAAELARNGAVVRKLASVESLAGVDVLCADKTGTLSENKLSVGDARAFGANTAEDVMLVASATCSRSLQGMDAIDRAILKSLVRYPGAITRLETCRLISSTPFDPVRKRAQAMIEQYSDEEPGGKRRVVLECLKGSPKAVASLVACGGGNEEDAVRMGEEAEGLAARGFRSLGVAKRVVSDSSSPAPHGRFEIVGIIPLFDPPRADAASTIREAQRLGLEVKMVTGDSLEIAIEMSRQLGVGSKIYRASEVFKDTQSLSADSGLGKLVEEADGFAEVFPQHKYVIIRELQQAGHLVAMTGDGVNDAPSLKAADTGIAVEGATSAARSAADIVFLRAGLSEIIDTVKTSRKIFQRMRAYVIYRIALSLQLEIFFLTTLVILDYVMDPSLVAFLAIFSDITVLAIAYDRASFSLHPCFWDLGHIWFLASILGVFLAGASWVLLSAVFFSPDSGIVQAHGDVDHVIFLQIALSQSWVIFVSRYSVKFDEMRFPAVQLVGAILCVDVMATLICLFGWLTGSGGTDIVTVILIWMYSIGVTVMLFLVFYVINRVEKI